MGVITETAHAPASERKVDQLLAHYAINHQNPRNEAIHLVAIPLIMLSLVGLLFALHPWVAYGFVALSMLYYARLSGIFLAAMLVLGAIGFVLVHAMGSLVLPLSIVIFVGAWIAQFIGHKIEGAKPSFFEDLQYLLVGPMFVVSKLFGKLGIRW